MKAKGMLLILLGILGLVGVLVYKSMHKTLLLIGPKSTIAFIVCAVLFVIGSRLLLKKPQ